MKIMLLKKPKLSSWWFALFFFLLLGTTARTQDPQFSQFYLASSYLNPGYTGIDGVLTAMVIDREQWGRVGNGTLVPGAFSSRAASIDFMLDRNLTHAIGAVLMHDVEGDGMLTTNYAALNYCYVLAHQQYDFTHNIRLGMGFYYAQKSIDWNRLVFSDQLHPKGPDFFNANSAHSVFYDDFTANPPWWIGVNFGIVYNLIQKNSNNENLQQLSLGLSINHLLNLVGNVGVESLQGLDSRQVPRITFSGQYYNRRLRFGNDENRLTFIPSWRIEYQSEVENYFASGISSFTAGGHLYIKNIGLGLYYHRNTAQTFSQSTDAFILAVDTEFLFGKNASLEIGLSYDINVSGLSGFSGGVLELGLKYRKDTYAKNGPGCPPVSRAHAERWENVFHKKQENKNLN